MTRLSNRQFPMLEQLASVQFMDLSEAAAFDQRPFRSMLVRGYCAYKPGKGFHLTEKGKAARREFFDTDIIRANPNLPLTAFFDPSAYGLAPRKKATRATKAPARAENVRDFIKSKSA